jgi:hypothetical protein
MDAAPLDPLIHQVTRLRIMTVLVKNRDAPFQWVQETLRLTPGNLDSHAGKLAAGGYLRMWKALGANGFQVRLAITPEGDRAFEAYLEALRSILDAP